MIGSLAGITCELRNSRLSTSKPETRNECAASAGRRGSLEFMPHDQIGAP